METNAPPPPQQMLQMITGFWVTQIVGTIAALGVIDALAPAPIGAADLAGRLGLEVEPLRRLIGAAKSLGLVVETDGRLAATPLGNTLATATPGSMRDMAIAQSSPGHWLPWGKCLDAVRTNRRQTPATLGMEVFEYYARTPAEGAAFSGAMAGLSGLVAGELVRVLPRDGAKRFVDLGGAAGTLVTTYLRAHEGMRGALFDLPDVADRVSPTLASFGGRVEVIAGDFFVDVPGGDLLVLKQVLHDWNDDQCETILRNCARSLDPGGRVVVVEMLLPEDGARSLAPLMDINMLVMLPGRERTRAEYAALFARAGLALDAVLDTHSPFSVLVARRA